MPTVVDGSHSAVQQTQLRIIDTKKVVAHRRVGRTFIYRPLCSRDQISSQFLHKVFDGALEHLVLSMLSAERVGSNELAELEQLIADARKQKRK